MTDWLITTVTEKMSFYFHDRMVGPCVQCVFIGTHWLQSLWSIVLDIIVRPLLLSAGRCCGGFSIHLAKE